MSQKILRLKQVKTILLCFGLISLFVILWLSVRAVQEKQNINSHASDFTNVSVKRVGTMSPNPSLRPTITPTPRTSPTQHPTATPTPKPTATPTTGFKKLLIEGEDMTSSEKATIFSDSNASSGKAIRILRSGSLVGQIQGAVKMITVRAKAENCFGYPHINVKIDGKFVLDQNITVTEYTDYVSDSLSYMNLGVSLHNIEIIYNNDATFVFCDRNVIIDKLTAE